MSFDLVDASYGKAEIRVAKTIRLPDKVFERHTRARVNMTSRLTLILLLLLDQKLIYCLSVFVDDIARVQRIHGCSFVGRKEARGKTTKKKKIGCLLCVSLDAVSCVCRKRI
jgi:hypothetical protein